MAGEITDKDEMTRQQTLFFALLLLSVTSLPYFIEVKRSIKNLPNGKGYFYIVSDLIFDGVRPDTWLTPEDADKETRSLSLSVAQR